MTSEIHHVAKKDSMSIFFRYRRPVDVNRVGSTIVSIHPWNITRNYTTKKSYIDAIVRTQSSITEKKNTISLPVIFMLFRNLVLLLKIIR